MQEIKILQYVPLCVLNLLTHNSDSFFPSAEILLSRLHCTGNCWLEIENHFCSVDLFFFFKLIILIRFAVKEIEVHDGTVGAGSVLFCFHWHLSDLRSHLGLASLTF